MIANAHHRHRRGLVSVAVLVALFVIGLVCAGLIKVAFARRGELTREERRVQAAWLADSGVDRALARLASAPGDYAGETWEVPTEEFSGRGQASVLIRVEKLADGPNRRKIHVQADYPTDSSLRARHSREVIVAIPSSTR